MSFGKLLIFSGLFLVVLGIFISVFPRLPGSLGRLPGDILIQKERFSFFFPLTTCLIFSLLLTLLLNLFFRR